MCATSPTSPWVYMLKFYSPMWLYLEVGSLLGKLLLFSCSEQQHARLPCPSLSPGVCSSSCPLTWWCYRIISSSAASFFFCLQSFPASGSFSMSWLFTSGSQSIGASVSSALLPINIQNWFPLGWTGLISLNSKGIWRVFSNTTVWKQQFFGTQTSLWSNSHIRS